MKKLILAILLCLSLIGCATTTTSTKDTPPDSTETQSRTVKYDDLSYLLLTGIMIFLLMKNIDIRF